jgi:hypothetical protein
MSNQAMEGKVGLEEVDNQVEDGRISPYKNTLYNSSCCGNKLEWQESIGDPNGAACVATCPNCEKMWLMVPHTVQLLERLPGSSQLIKAVFSIPTK